jgi:hypothetical protein
LAGVAAAAWRLESASQNSKMDAPGRLQEIRNFLPELYDSDDEYV